MTDGRQGLPFEDQAKQRCRRYKIKTEEKSGQHMSPLRKKNTGLKTYHYERPASESGRYSESGRSVPYSLSLL